MPAKFTPLTNSRAAAQVSGDTLYAITMGHPSSAVSRVAVPEATSAASLAATIL